MCFLSLLCYHGYLWHSCYHQFSGFHTTSIMKFTGSSVTNAKIVTKFIDMYLLLQGIETVIEFPADDVTFCVYK
jgi:hypothetical protein